MAKRASKPKAQQAVASDAPDRRIRVPDDPGPDEIDMELGGAERDMEDTPTADEAEQPEEKITYGMSGDAGGIMAPASSDTFDQDYSGGGSGMDDESANTTSRSGIGGGAGFSTSRATMGDEDGMTSLEAGRADVGGVDPSVDNNDMPTATEDRDEADTAMNAGSGYAVTGRVQDDDVLDKGEDFGDIRGDAVSYSGSATGPGENADEAIDTSDVALTKHFSGTGTGASDVGRDAGGVTDDDIRSSSDPRTGTLSNDEAMALEAAAKPKRVRKAPKKK